MAVSNPVRNICYSLPRFITMGIQCTFCSYMWELYTTEFGWMMSEWEVISRTCTGTQILSFIALGAIYTFAIDGLTTGQPKDWAKGILIGGTFFHWFTYLFLIILPIKWHGVKTPFVDSLLGKQSQFFKAMFLGPLSLSTMISSRRLLWITFNIIYSPVRLCWAVFYPLTKLCFLCIVNFGVILTLVNYPIRPLLKPKKSPTLESIPPPACSACCNTTCCNNFAMWMRHAGQFMGTRTFLLYILAVAHGIGVSAHELSNTAVPHYIYGGAGSFSAKAGERGKAITVNLSFFFISNFLIYMLFSLLKFYAHIKSPFTETFYLISILFFILQIPILPGFWFGTEEESKYQKATATPDVKECFILVSLTVFHATTLFWMFSGGPLTFYVSMFVLDGHVGIRSFGVLINFAGLLGASIINMIVTDLKPGTSATDIGAVNDRYAHKAISGVCIVSQFFSFMLFYRHDWPWNKDNGVNYFLIIATGVVNSVFVGYTNIMMHNLTASSRVKHWKWLFYGIFYGATNIGVTAGMLVMFKSFGRDEMINFGCKCFRFPYHLCFPTVYKTITGVFMLANAIAMWPILHPDYYQKLSE